MRLVHFDKDSLRKICVPDSAAIREAMTVMSNNSLRLIPVVRPGTMQLSGVLADGDIRRYLSGAGTVDDPVVKAFNASPVTRTEPLAEIDARRELQALGVEYLPVTHQGDITDMFVLWAVNTPLDTVAVIMAGGLGSRLAPHTNNCPKPLLELGGRPILTHIIEHLREQGINRFVLSLNYLGDMIVNQYGNGQELGVQIDYVHEAKRLGTGGALSLINPNLLTDPFLCMNGDILTDVDVNAMLDQHRSNGWHGTMATKDFHYTVPYGVVKRSDAGKFQGSDEKPTLSFPINAGIYMLSKEVLPHIPKEEFFDLPTLFDHLSGNGNPVGTYNHAGRWIDIGTVDELDRARKLFENRGPA